MRTATVYIWYPKNLDKGHAAMLIGEDYTHDDYVSWWPTGIRQRLPIRARRALDRTLAGDAKEYERPPDREYYLDNLDVEAMRTEWSRIRGYEVAGAERHYELFTKNCALTVKSVLAAGLPPGAPRLHSLDWTPKDIALWCSQYLASSVGGGDKTKRGADSKWSAILYAMMRMR